MHMTWGFKWLTFRGPQKSDYKGQISAIFRLKTKYIKPNSHYQNNVATYMKLWAKFYTLSIQLTPAPQLI